MQYNARILAVVAGCVCVAASGFGEGAPAPKPLRLEVSLTDGSRLLGETTLTSIPVISDGLGKMDISLGFIRSIAFAGEGQPATLKLSNGDAFKGSVSGLKEFSVATLFGPVSVPLKAVREMRVHPGQTGKIVDWNALPFPKECNWPAARGEAATVGLDEIVLRGQPVCTAQTFSAPMSFEFEAALDQLVSDDGCMWVVLIPDGVEAETNIPPQNAAIQLGYHQRGPGGGMFTIACMGAAPTNLAPAAFELSPRKAYQVGIEVTADTIRATLNGETYETKYTLPFKAFHVEIMGWQPTNTWHVRDFVFH